MPQPDYVLQCHQLGKQFAEFTAVHPLDLNIRTGEFFSILGPSGCGKTTLLRMLAGFESPTHGRITLNSHDVTDTPPNKRPLNMVFQHLALFPNMSVADNIAFGLKQRGEQAGHIKRKVQDILQRVDLKGSETKQTHQLSGGQKQRVALARSLVLEPKVLLLDEPLGALDLKLREQMKIELKHLQKSFGTTFIYITHDQSEALMMSDRIAVMNAGHFEQMGTPSELYMRPSTPFVAEFVGENNRIISQVADITPSTLTVVTQQNTTLSLPRSCCQTPLTTGQTIQLYLRPEALSMSDDSKKGDPLSGQLKELLFDGATSGAIVSTVLGELRLSITPSQLNELQSKQGIASANSTTVNLRWDPNQAIGLGIAK
ncbi:ABC transporter ATP-binding protein [Vibrio superstes]|uniref:Polyamine-transporting ATPase n=1 Tax=Vibrio superstes NBRC 103154 TaxID=1219062 RepID=A0A511QRN2_9VIBR|nr:ABC transporter ATP-binding protein [Vibrio superstes]GEM79242.1 polyamine-transporting ATPase [Vibrio superstes NBRC 103154]